MKRREGEKAKEERLGDFRFAMNWLTTEAERTTARQRYKGTSSLPLKGGVSREEFCR